MRLSDKQIYGIQNTCRAMVSGVDDQTQLWLFGSRVHDAMRGGDVDLCLLSSLSVAELMNIKLMLRPRLEEVLDLPVDLVVQSQQQAFKPITQQALLTGIRLI